jgi:ATP-binding cassette subfamily B protein
MYVALFRQGQATVSAMLTAVGGMYEDNLYLSTLYEYLETEVQVPAGTQARGPQPQDGVRFEDVSFTYPGAEEPALSHITLHLVPGTSLALVGENGSGKTTLIKLLTRLYVPTSGRILLEGLDLKDWDERVLRERVGVIFQDFARYQMLVGENVGAGDEQYFEDEARWRTAAEKGRASDFIETLPGGYHTQLGKWFKDGRELSGGQWQKIALARAFMRSRADVLVLDEPTAAMDAQAESEVFEHFRQLARASPSSSRTASPPCAWPTRSWCSTTATSSNGAATRNSCGWMAAMRTSSRSRRAVTADRRARLPPWRPRLPGASRCACARNPPGGSGRWGSASP